MKQLKFLMLAFLMGISLTSCLNSSDDSTRTGLDVVKVQTNMFGSPVFYTVDGRTITPSSASVSSAMANGTDFSKYEGHVAQLLYQWDSSLIEITEDTKDIKDITIAELVSMESEVEIVRGLEALNDSVSDMPIISLNKDMSGIEYKPYFWGRTLVLPIEYYLGNSMHNFTLEYHPEQQLVENEWTLVLEHSKANDKVNTMQTSWDFAVYGSLFVYYRAFDLTEILYEAGGAMPESINIEYKENISTELEDAESKVYTAPYKDESEQ